MTAIAKPGLRQAKYTTHTDSECESHSILTIDIRATWKAFDKADESTIIAAIYNIERSIATLDVWRQYLEQKKEATNGAE